VAEPAEAHFPQEPVSSELGERVRAIVAAAEGMASSMREEAEQYAEARRREAEEEAGQRLREARERADRLVQERLLRMSELSDSIVARAEAVLDRLGAAEEVRRQLDQIVNTLGDTAQQLSDEQSAFDDVRPMPPPGEERTVLRPVEPLDPPQSEHDRHLEAARLVALQMAVAGRSREEVGAHLREAFSIEDPEPILEQIFTEDLPAQQG
jgi:vacuolar-type H+-ATPase subunit H